MYTYEDHRVLKLYSLIPSLPDEILPSQVLKYYRYDTTSKDFKEIPSNKNFSYAVDAVQLGNKK